MALQNAIFVIWLAGASLIALSFIYVIVQSRKPADDESTRNASRTSRKLQGWLFVVMLVAFVVGSWATLRNFPIPVQRGSLEAGQTVDAVSRLWSWQLTPSTVMTGTPVEFRVTSADVNHGFAIYAPDGRIVTQAQAMPGYTNRVLHAFTTPGTYTVQCLEYCGIGHGPMRTTFEVIEPGQATNAAASVATQAGTSALSLVDRGKQLSQNNGCLACHAATAAKGIGPGWGGLYGAEVRLDDGSTAIADDAYILQSIRDPAAKVVVGYIKGLMPPVGSQQMSDDDIAAVVAYIRSLKAP